MNNYYANAVMLSSLHSPLKTNQNLEPIGNSSVCCCYFYSGEKKVNYSRMITNVPVVDSKLKQRINQLNSQILKLPKGTSLPLKPLDWNYLVNNLQNKGVNITFECLVKQLIHGLSNPTVNLADAMLCLSLSVLIYLQDDNNNINLDFLRPEEFKLNQLENFTDNALKLTYIFQAILTGPGAYLFSDKVDLRLKGGEWLKKQQSSKQQLLTAYHSYRILILASAMLNLFLARLDLSTKTVSTSPNDDEHILVGLANIYNTKIIYKYFNSLLLNLNLQLSIQKIEENSPRHQIQQPLKKSLSDFINKSLDMIMQQVSADKRLSRLGNNDVVKQNKITMLLDNDPFFNEKVTNSISIVNSVNSISQSKEEFQFWYLKYDESKLELQLEEFYNTHLWQVF